MRRLKTYTLTGVITLVSGTRIGGSDDTLKIGGTDLTCIKDPTTDKPYLPGSSLKGKMRSSLEKRAGVCNEDKPSKKGPIARVFGPHMNKHSEEGPTRIRVHDALLLDDSSFAYENKTESVNNRVTGSAEHPRTLERVTPGARFGLRIDYDIYDIDNDELVYTDQHEGQKHRGEDAIAQIVADGLEELCQMGIGGGTSRGYGQIDISDVAVVEQKRRLHIQFPQNTSAG